MYVPHERVYATISGVSRTKQSHTAETDINTIVARYTATGNFTHINRNTPKYGDFSKVGDYQQALDAVLEAQYDFDELPAVIRKRMDNDPGKLIEFLADPANLEEGRKLGLFEPEKPSPKVPVSEGDSPQSLPDPEGNPAAV